jgi:hypothetical protein
MRAIATAKTRPARSRAGFSLGATCRGTACAAALLVVATQARAQVLASAEYLARMDTDTDGRVSLVEYQDWLSYAFDRMDVDGDGVLAPSEQPGGRGRPVTRQAHRARLADAFGRQDQNRDGTLSAAELAAPPR